MIVVSFNSRDMKILLLFFLKRMSFHVIQRIKEQNCIDTKNLKKRLNFEFNIKFENLNDLKLVDKLLYKSASDATWGEYECKLPQQSAELLSISSLNMHWSHQGNIPFFLMFFF